MAGWFDDLRAQQQAQQPLPVIASQMGEDYPRVDPRNPPGMQGLSRPAPPDTGPGAVVPMPNFPQPPGPPMAVPGSAPSNLPPGVSAQPPQQGAPMQAPQPINSNSPEWRAMSQEAQMQALDAHLAQQEAYKRYLLQSGQGRGQGFR